jgi:hypothetical protein
MLWDRCSSSPRSWLLWNYMSPLMAYEASCQTGCVTGDLHPQSTLWAKQVMCRVIPIPEPTCYMASVHRSRSRLCAYRFYVSSLTTHEALCHTGNMTGVHRPDDGFMLTGFICLPWRHTRLYAIQEIWRVFILPGHGFMPIGFTCRFDDTWGIVLFEMCDRSSLSWITAVRLPTLSEFVIKILVTK